MNEILDNSKTGIDADSNNEKDNRGSRTFYDQNNNFNPGEKLYIKPEWRRKASPEYNSARVTTPARAAFHPFNYTFIAPGFGGGGLGFSIDTLNTEIELSVKREGKDSNHIVFQHYIKLFKEITGYTGDDLSMNILKKIEHTNSGFGSNSALCTSIIAGLNALFGSPFSLYEVWDIVVHNNVEVADETNELYHGDTTGISTTSHLYGGLVWIDEGEGHGDGRYLGSIDTSELWTVTAVGVIHKIINDKFKNREEMAEFFIANCGKLCMEHQEAYGSEYKELTDKKLRPLFYKNDIDAFASECWKINEIGRLSFFGQIYKYDIYSELFSLLKSKGALFASITSGGPGVFALAKNEKTANGLKEIFETRFKEYYINPTAGRVGKRMKIELR